MVERKVAVGPARENQRGAPLLPRGHRLQGYPGSYEVVTVQRGHVEVAVPPRGTVSRPLAKRGVLVKLHSGLA